MVHDMYMARDDLISVRLLSAAYVFVCALKCVCRFEETFITWDLQVFV